MGGHSFPFFLLLSLTTFSSLFFVSCSDDDHEAYPAIVTEMVMSSSNAECLFLSFTTDSGLTFTIITPLKGPSANVRWRFLCGYVDEGHGQAHVYSMVRVPLLNDFTSYKDALHDPTGYASVWKAGGYLNMHLLPRTQGGKQAWGFLRDSTLTNPAGGTNHYLSLCHHQQKDPTSYTDDLFLSISLDSIAANRQPHDSLIFSINTFDGWRTWSFSAE